MKNALYIDFENNKIVMTSLFAKNCANTSSAEYRQLQSVRKDYPEYKVITREIKKNPNKESYKGLTYDYMEDYILTHEDAENADAVLAELAEMRLIAACHSKAFRYPVIKKWFLDKYPEVKNFGKPAPAEEVPA